MADEKKHTGTQIDSKLEEGPSSVINMPMNTPRGLRKPVDLYYDMNKKGLAIIFNQYRFENKADLKRTGTEHDVIRLEECLPKLNIGVKVYDDLTADQIKTVMRAVSQTDSANWSCIMIFVLTHGHTEYLMATDRSYHISVLWNDLIGKLPGIPKLFFIEACRGSRVDHGVEVTDSIGENLKIPIMADFLRMYSSCEFYQSYREVCGSWFIQTLCNVFEELAAEYDLVRMLTIVAREVAFSFEANTGCDKIHGAKSMPQFESTLTKFLKFTAKENKEKN